MGLRLRRHGRVHAYAAANTSSKTVLSDEAPVLHVSVRRVDSMPTHFFRNIFPENHHV